jgi:histidinol-phosphate aminotransferase
MNMIEKKIHKRVRELGAYKAGLTKEEVAKKHGLDVKDIIKLASNENPFGPSPKVVETIQRFSSSVSLYPPDYPPEMIRAISKYTDLPQNMILPGGNGADEIMDLVIKMAVSQGDEVIIHTPTFPYYELLVKLYGGVVVKVPMLEDYSFPIDTLQVRMTKKTKLVIICSPNNPTGNTISESGLKKILNKAPLVMLDEAYIEFANQSLTGLVKDYENLVVLRTFSKAFALAGLRVGYGVANDKFVKQAMKIKPPHNVNLLAQKSATAALEDKRYMREKVKEIKKLREKLFYNLEKISGIKAYPSQANFLLLTLKNGDAGKVVFSLEKKGIIVRGCKGFGMKNSIRVTIGTKEENQAFLQALTEVLG